MLVPKGNTLLSPTSALSNMLPRHRSMTFQGSHQKWHRPAAIRTKISWWKPTTWQLHLHLVEDLDLRFPTRFLQLPPRCKEKGDLKGTKAKCSKKPLLNLFKWHRDGCFQKEKHIQNKEDLRWMGYSRTQSVNIGEATIWKHFNPKSGLVGHNVGMLRAIETLKQGKKSWTHATSSTNHLEKFHSQFRV